MKSAITIAALAGLTTPALAQNIATITLTASAETVGVGETVTIGVVVTDNIAGNSIMGFDVEVASAGSMSIAGITAPTPDASIFGFNGAATPTGATGLGGSPDILGPTFDPSLDGVTVYTFQFTVTSTGSRTFTPMDGAGPNSALQWAMDGGIVLVPGDYDEYIFNSVTVRWVPAPTTMTLFALAPLACARRRR